MTFRHGIAAILALGLAGCAAAETDRAFVDDDLGVYDNDVGIYEETVGYDDDFGVDRFGPEFGYAPDYEVIDDGVGVFEGDLGLD